VPAGSDVLNERVQHRAILAAAACVAL
jgi:hypothetical protein